MGRGRRRRSQGRQDTLLQGVLLVDKPAGMTSHDVCRVVRSRLRLGKVGHGGTLDPFATGLLPLMLNGATRLMPLLQTVEKEYLAVVRLGTRTDTMDPTGEVTEERPTDGVTDDAIRTAAAGFLGKQTQQVPRYAAARVDGKHLYEYAREGEEVELPTKEVDIQELEVQGIDRGEHFDIRMRVSCSAGTYVRALADDLGELLGCGAHLAELRRTRTGGHSIVGALGLQSIIDQADAWRVERGEAAERGEETRFEPPEHARRWAEYLGPALVPVHRVLGDIPRLELSPELVARVEQGQPLRKGALAPHASELEAAAFDRGDRLVLAHPDGLRAVALLRAAVSRDSMPRRGPDDIVLEVERMLR